MGLLDELLAGVSGQGRADEATGREPQGQPGGTSMGNVMVALLPVVLSMIASQRGAPATGFGRGTGGTGGGLGDLLAGLLRGGGGAGGAGGLADLLAQFQRAGFGQQAQSWVSRGQNQIVEPEAVEKVFGRGGLRRSRATRGSARTTPRAASRDSSRRWWTT
jgi:uncharacterized protein YidB (DUF937 family)